MKQEETAISQDLRRGQAAVGIGRSVSFSCNGQKMWMLLLCFIDCMDTHAWWGERKKLKKGNYVIACMSAGSRRY